MHSCSDQYKAEKKLSSINRAQCVYSEISFYVFIHFVDLTRGLYDFAQARSLIDLLLETNQNVGEKNIG